MGTDRIEPEKRLRRDVESALRRALDPSEVLPMLHRLARTAAPGSEERVFAHRQLAELLAERSPWRAAIYARRVIAERPDDDRGWALLGLSQTLLGHYRFAVTAYQKALSCAPRNPWYAHNLGHLLDVALDRANDALGWLRTAYAEAAELGHSASDDIAASFAHALGRAGKVGEAKRVLLRAMKRGGASREHEALLEWIERGAPAGRRMQAARRVRPRTRSRCGRARDGCGPMGRARGERLPSAVRSTRRSHGGSSASPSTTSSARARGSSRK